MPKTKKEKVEPTEEVGPTIKKEKESKDFTGLDIAKKAIQKKYGKVMSYLGDHGDMQIPTISTGSLGLDIALGRGGLAKGRIYEVFGPPSGGKCLGADTYISSEYGLVTLRELFDINNTPVYITSKIKEARHSIVNEHGEYEKTTHFVWNGKHKVNKVMTTGGFEIEATDNHRFRVIDRDTGLVVWKYTKDLTIDDYILLYKGGNDKVKEDFVTEDEAVFLGMLVSEGYLNAKNKFTFSNSDDEMLYRFAKLCKDLYDYDVKMYQKKGSKAKDLAVFSKTVRESLYQDFGLDYVVAKGKTVPYKIRRSSNKIVSKFLSYYFSLDGCYEKDGSISASSASKELLRQIQLLLLDRFGIKSTVFKKFNKIYSRFYYHIYIGGEDIMSFMKNIGFVLKNKIDRVKSFNYDYSNFFTFRWNFPYQVNLIGALCKDVDGNRRSIGVVGHNLYDSSRRLSHDCIEKILATFYDLNPGQTALMILNHFKTLRNYVCDKICEIKEKEEVPVFDLVLPKTHSFLANGLVSHNSSLAMSTIVQAQKRGMSCAFVDAEHAVDPSLFKAMGANINDVLIIQGYSGEANLDISEMLMKSNGVDVLVIDSVSALIPQSEAEAGIEQDFMALLARLMSKALRRLVPIANETETLLIFINQIRQKIGSWGSPETTSGGEALNFYSTGRISVRGGEYKKSRIVDPISGEVVGHNTKFEIVKNKLAPPFRSAEVPLIYGLGYDIYWETLNLAIAYEVVEKGGAWFNYGDKVLGQGEVNTLSLLREDADLYEEIKNKIIDKAGLKKYYERNSG